MTTATIDIRRRLGGGALVLGPLALLGNALAHPKEVTDAGKQLHIVAGALNRWYLAHLLYLVATVLLTPAVLVALEGIGGWQLAQSPDRPAASRILDHLIHRAGVVVPFAIVGLTLSIGLVVLAVGLARTGQAPVWVAWTLGAGAVLLAVGLVAELHVAFLGGVVAIAVALAAAGLDDLALKPAVNRLGARSTAGVVAHG